MHQKSKIQIDYFYNKIRQYKPQGKVNKDQRANRRQTTQTGILSV